MILARSPVLVRDGVEFCTYVPGAPGGIEVDSSLCGNRVARVRDRLVAARDRPARIVLDNGSEFTGREIDRWAYEHEVKLAFIQPRKPVQKAFVDSTPRLRDKCLNEHWFLNLNDAREIVDNWRIDYNLTRPHSSLGGMTPAEFAVSLTSRVSEINQNKHSQPAAILIL